MANGWVNAVVATTSLKTTNRLLSKLKSIVSYRDHKRTWLGVLNTFLHYLYMVHANDE